MQNSSKRITQAFILGAGLGTRLGTSTNLVPKVMLPIAPGKPLLEHTVEHLRRQGIEEFIINLHYLSRSITTHFGNGSKWGIRITYSDETGKLLETGGALKKAEHLLDDDFLFMYGDELHFFGFEEAVAVHFERGALATIILKKSDLPENAEIAEIDAADRRVLRWHTRPHRISEFSDTRLLNSGLYVFSKRIVRYIAAGVPTKLDGEVIPRALAAGEPLYGFPTEEAILDIGTPEKYETARKFYLSRTRGSRQV